MVARMSETTLYRWIEKGKHAKRGPHREFWDSLQAAHAHFEKFHLKAIARSSLEETQSTREVIEYEGGEVVTLPDGKRQLRPGKVKSVRREIRTHPPTLQGSMWLLERRFPDKWGPPRKELPAADRGAPRALHPERLPGPVAWSVEPELVPVTSGHRAATGRYRWSSRGAGSFARWGP